MDRGRRGLVGLFVNKFITTPRVDGSHPCSSSFFVGHTRQLETKTLAAGCNDVEREDAITRERRLEVEVPAGERGVDVKSDSVRSRISIKW